MRSRHGHLVKTGGKSLLWASLITLGAVGEVAAQEKGPKQIGTAKLDTVNLQSTMNFDDCHQYSASISVCRICILLGAGSFQCVKIPPIRCVPTNCGKFDYWEPSELIEVSCRKGFSLLLPGGVGEQPKDQSCASSLGGIGKPGRWFFDARVWAIHGGKGAARQQAAGGSYRDQSVACGGNEPLIRLDGYGIKFDKFSKGGTSGPGMSWQAYISDYDSSWAVDGGGKSSPGEAPKEKECSGTSVENCWGPLKPLMGWVHHPHQPVAAALAGWRAHTKAQGKVSPDNGNGYKMEMDYPFIMQPGPYAKSMNMPGGGGGGGRTKGSRCFQPGDPGPYWYTNGQQNLKPEQVPQAVKQMKEGDVAQASVMPAGVYIFTVWVRTGCQLFQGIDGTNVQKALNGCKDKQFY